MEFISGTSIRIILLHNQNWWRFFTKFQDKIREAILDNVIKVLACKTKALGCHQFVCPSCGVIKTVPHSCKSRFCSSCGKKATEQWIQQQLESLPRVPWQHITFTLPAELRPLFWLNRQLFNHIIPIPAAILTKIAKQKNIIPGLFLALHTFGRDLKPNVHFHVSVTSGGLSLDKNKWVPSLYFYHQTVKNCWKARVVNLLRKLYKKGELILPNSLAHIKKQASFNSWINVLYQKQWVVHLAKPCKNHKRNITYLGRYLKRPPLSETRIQYYDGHEVAYEYHDHHDKKTYTMRLPVFSFIERLIRHIPDRYFRLIRYYNWLSNRTRGHLLPLVHGLIKQPTPKKKKLDWRTLFIQTFHIDPLCCSSCQSLLQLINITLPLSLTTLMDKHQELATAPADLLS